MGSTLVNLFYSVLAFADISKSVILLYLVVENNYSH